MSNFNQLRNAGMTIGDFAEKLMESGAVKPQNKSAPVQTPKAPVFEQRDISKVQVPDDFMKQVLGNKYTPQRTQNKVSKKVIQESTQVQPVQLLNEEKVDELISLLRDVKNLLSEMTTAGSIGVNLAGPKKMIKPKTRSEAFKLAFKKNKK